MGFIFLFLCMPGRFFIGCQTLKLFFWRMPDIFVLLKISELCSLLWSSYLGTVWSFQISFSALIDKTRKMFSLRLAFLLYWDEIPLCTLATALGSLGFCTPAFVTRHYLRLFVSSGHCSPLSFLVSGPAMSSCPTCIHCTVVKGILRWDPLPISGDLSLCSDTLSCEVQLPWILRALRSIYSTQGNCQSWLRRLPPPFTMTLNLSPGRSWYNPEVHLICFPFIPDVQCLENCYFIYFVGFRLFHSGG